MDLDGQRRIIPGRRAADSARKAGGAKLSPEYRHTVDATVALLDRYRDGVASDRALAFANAGQCDPLSAIAEDLWRDWHGVWADAAECLSEIARDSDHVAAAKSYTESHLTSKLLDAALWRQAYVKPLGYPGDYVVMNHIYDGIRVGDTAFARLAHALAVQIGQFVVRRKNLVRQTITELVAERGESVSIASLGCGPAREIAEYVANGVDVAGTLTFTLVDQDTDALRFAGHSISDAMKTRKRESQIRVEPRRVSILRLLRDLEPNNLLSQPDMIYSAGLFDYFSDRTCRVLTKRLYAALRPRGTLLLCNMKAGTDMAWPLEFIADWSLAYRSAENIMTWTEGLEGAEITLRTEATGYDYLLALRKPG